MTPNELFEELRASFRVRKFTAGLLLAFIDYLVELAVPGLGLSSLEDFLERFRCQKRTRADQYVQAPLCVVRKALSAPS